MNWEPACSQRWQRIGAKAADNAPYFLNLFAAALTSEEPR
jgi:hypothetical protein